jgi:hypothetical protein
MVGKIIFNMNIICLFCVSYVSQFLLIFVIKPMLIDKLINVQTFFSFEEEREEGILNFKIVLDMKAVCHIHITIEHHIKY